METESEISELRDEVDGLRQGFEAMLDMQQAMQGVIEELVRTVFRDPKIAMLLAKKIDAMASERELINEHDSALNWLRTLRDDLLSWHDLAPLVKQAFERGELRPIPMRERLTVVPAADDIAPSGQDSSVSPAP